MLSAKKLLENARNRIVKRENWTNSGLVESNTPCDCGDPSCNQMITTCHPDASAWCALGSLAAEAGIDKASTTDMLVTARQHENARTALDALVQAVTDLWPEFALRYHPSTDHQMIFGINDCHGHESVLKMFDHAIGNLRSE